MLHFGNHSFAKPSTQPNRLASALLIVWLWVSALYYIDNLFSPNYLMGYEEGVEHKALKYAACMAFSIAFIVTSKAYSVFIFLLSTLFASVFFFLHTRELDVSILTILIISTMLPFILVLDIFQQNLQKIGRAIVYAGAVVGVFSVIELTVLSYLFESIWKSTESIRSVSTLFNPNNLGLYAGVCLILIPSLKLHPWLAGMLVLPIFFSFVASGSRTAWVAIGLVGIYALLCSSEASKLITAFFRKYFLVGLAFFACLIAALLVFQYAQNSELEIETANRGADLYTASIRLENFFRFFDAIDLSIFFPDIREARTEFIQDNFYLVALNSFGITGVALLFLFLIVTFSVRLNSNRHFRPWRLVVLFYLVSGTSGSHLNSFPNNQLFFIALGSVLVLKRRPRVFTSAQTIRATQRPSEAGVVPLIKVVKV